MVNFGSGAEKVVRIGVKGEGSEVKGGAEILGLFLVLITPVGAAVSPEKGIA